MSKKPVYILNDAILIRKGNTLYVLNKDGKTPVPIETTSDIYCYGKVSVRSGASSLLFKKKIPAHFFNKYGFYEGSLIPRDHLNSGLVIVKQAEHYLQTEKRIKIAKEMVNGIKYNILKTLKYYEKKGRNVTEYIEKIENEEIIETNIQTLLSAEGKIWLTYYQSFSEIIRKFEFKTRQIRPPTDEVNALISFGNSLLYTTTLTELYNTYLHPSISFLHEPSERRYSLSLDVADIFKPLIVERIIFKLVNNNIIEEKDFDKEVGVLLNKNGKRKFLQEYHDKLNTTVKHPTLKRKVTYRRLIRLEGYKLVKHVLGDKTYRSFKTWW